MAGGIEGDTFVGKRVQELSGLLKIRYPLEHGIVTNWDDMELIWRHVYSEELGLDISQVKSCIHGSNRHADQIR